MKKRLVRLALAAVTIAAPGALLSPSAFAQAISVNGGSIQGTITDPSGAAVSGAAISITSPETGFRRDLSTRWLDRRPGAISAQVTPDDKGPGTF